MTTAKSTKQRVRAPEVDRLDIDLLEQYRDKLTEYAEILDKAPTQKDVARLRGYRTSIECLLELDTDRIEEIASEIEEAQSTIQFADEVDDAEEKAKSLSEYCEQLERYERLVAELGPVPIPRDYEIQRLREHNDEMERRLQFERQQRAEAESLERSRKAKERAAKRKAEGMVNNG